MLRSERLTRSLPIMVLTGLLTFVPATALADLTDPSQIPDPKSVIDFESVPVGALEPNDLLDEGIIFPDAPNGETILFFSGEHVLFDSIDGEIKIEFVDLVQAAGADFQVAPGLELMFTAFDDSYAEIGSTTRTGSGFFGIDGGDVMIRSIIIDGAPGRFVIDNLTFGGVETIPAPPAILLGAIGLGIVGWIRPRTFGKRDERNNPRSP